MRSTVEVSEAEQEKTHAKKDLKERWMVNKLKEVLRPDYLDDLFIPRHIQALGEIKQESTKLEKSETEKSEFFEYYLSTKREKVHF
jgi:hypothetical protein